MRVGGSPSTLKRRRLTPIDPMEDEAAKIKLEAAKQKYGREIRVFETLAASPTSMDVPSSEERDDFYEFTAEDYYRVLATKKEDKFLKTRKIREAEEAARRSRITKAVIRVRFPDNCTLEATFHPSETIQSLVDLLKKVIAQPELPFYIYTTPPKKHVKDMSQDFYSAGFIPGAIVYFSYDLPNGGNGPTVSGSYLKEDVSSLKGLELIPEQQEPVEAALEPAAANSSPAVPERKPADKKPAKPKWLKL
ncbi:plant UBX domain-containing protein 1-like [Rhododendron vialii]|uniref:plant UBX domain-containing protein 1-like n=1 Tax=Rhododendron vialii TaxID=182163 RepID=UPI00265FFF75|nr:plant UBX domain-containing protein 1-like [Rhododendron vialii]XP_058228304.1 plant UBX domain-containing protein 1-like [Rhododendron vialii]XP_058228305.1 plant UBX domain-containing protein 1-like [Rhododendron vialii]